MKGKWQNEGKAGERYNNSTAFEHMSVLGWEWRETTLWEI